MGRDAGWLTAAAALARNGYNSAPHLIYLPEVPFDTDDFLLDVKRMLFERNNVIIAVSEGIRMHPAITSALLRSQSIHLATAS